MSDVGVAASVSRRALMAGATVAAAALAAGARVAAPPTGLRPMERPQSFLLPNTSYFETVSTVAGAPYAIWVTTPADYARAPDRRYPVVYVTDGNLAAPSFIPHHALLSVDPIGSTKPFILVCVGFPPQDAPRALAVRARDLLPPHEALPEGMIEGMRAAKVDALLDRDGIDLYIRNLQNPAADKFLGFLTDELHPQLAARYRFDEAAGAGLFGYSYGGLFSIYAALRRTSLFRRIGAGSPGILARRSKIFEMYRAALAAKTDFAGRRLHITLNQRELTDPSFYQPLVAEGTAEFITLAGQQPLPGLAVTSHLFADETHMTGNFVSFASFLKTCYAAG